MDPHRDRARRPSLALPMMAVLLLLLSGCLAPDPVMETDDPFDEGPDEDNNDAAPGNGGDQNDTAPPARPVARFSVSDPAPAVGEQIVFNASESHHPDGTITLYSWDFDAGDGIGTDAQGMVVTHTYIRPGQYTVTLVVEDSRGATATAQKTVNVGEGAEAGERAVDITTSQGNSGTLSVPLNPMNSGDTSHSWDMPGNTVRILIVLQWSEPEWHLGLEAGPTGAPAVISDSGWDGTLTLRYTAPAGGSLSGNWNAMVIIMNPEDHVRVVDRCAYTITVRAYVVD